MSTPFEISGRGSDLEPVHLGTIHAEIRESLTRIMGDPERIAMPQQPGSDGGSVLGEAPLVLTNHGVPIAKFKTLATSSGPIAVAEFYAGAPHPDRKVESSPAPTSILDEAYNYNLRTGQITLRNSDHNTPVLTDNRLGRSVSRIHGDSLRFSPRTDSGDPKPSNQELAERLAGRLRWSGDMSDDPSPDWDDLLK